MIKNHALSAVFYNDLLTYCPKDPVMFLSFGVCIALEMVLFVFANDSSVNSQNIAILQKLKTLEEEMSMLKQTKLKTLEDEVSMLKQRELKTLEEVSMLKQSLKSCQSGCNESSKSNTDNLSSEYKPCLFGYLKP